MKIDCIRAYNYPKADVNRKVNFNSHVDWFDDEPLSPIFESLLEYAYGSCGVVYTGSTSVIPDTCRLEDVSHNIMNFRILGNSSYSGETLANKPEYFKLLGNSGVTKVIDLVNNQKVKEYCDKHGLDYYSYDMTWGYGGQALFKDEKSLLAEQEKTATVRKLKNLRDEVNKGHFYMACEFGEFRTVNCLALVSIFNPEWRGEKIAPTSEFVQKFKNLFANLTAEHKQILGLSDDYCKYLGSHIAKLLTKI